MGPARDNPIVLVIGVGNSFRSDDGVGPRIARSIAAMNLPGVEVREESGEGASLMDTWHGFARVFLIDATSSGRPPGTALRFDAATTPIPAELFHYSTHAFSVAEAVEMARALGELPPRLVLYGIEGETFAAGQALSEPVNAAIDDVVRRLCNEISGVESPNAATSPGGSSSRDGEG